jgi:hypothetical protein
MRSAALISLLTSGTATLGPKVPVEGCWSGKQAIQFCNDPCDVTYHVSNNEKSTPSQPLYNVRMDVRGCPAQCADSLQGTYTGTMTRALITYEMCPPTIDSAGGKGQCHYGGQCCYGTGKPPAAKLQQGAWYKTSFENDTNTLNVCQNTIANTNPPGESCELLDGNFLVKMTKCIQPPKESRECFCHHSDNM